MNVRSVLDGRCFGWLTRLKVLMLQAERPAESPALLAVVIVSCCATFWAGASESPQPASIPAWTRGTTNAVSWRAGAPGGRVYVSPSGSNTTGASWAEALHEIGAGLELAAASGALEVWVSGGTYAESIGLITGVTLYGGFHGTETAIEDRGTTPSESILDGSTARDGDAAHHVVVLDAIGQARLDGFTIRGGNADGSGTDRYGGGVFCRDLDATCEIANCTITGNRAASGGAGISCERASPTITQCKIIANESSDDGGGIYCLGSGPKIADCAIVANSARNGAGIFCISVSPTIAGCLIGANVAASFGGGVFCYDAEPPITNCTIGGNSAGQMGGGVWCEASDATLANSTISGNSAGTAAGAMYCTGSPVLVNCTVSANSAGEFADGVCADQVAAPLLLNTIFEGHARHAVYERALGADFVTSHCLFFLNEGGDYYDENSTTYQDAEVINQHVLGAGGNATGDPAFVMDRMFPPPFSIED